MDYRDYYQTLGIDRSASQADIKKAFRKLARQHHPDVKGGDAAAETRFKEINEANAVLSDPEKRRQYDELGANWEAYARAGGRAGGNPFATGGPFAGFGSAGGGRRGRVEFVEDDGSGFSDFFRMFFTGRGPGVGGPDAGSAGGARARTASARRAAGGTRTTEGATFDDILAGMGFAPGGTPPAGGPFAGPAGVPGTGTAIEAHPRLEVEITLEEAYRGTSRLVEIDGRRLEVRVPRGVDTGSRIRLRGKGGGTGEDARDLYLVVRVLPHPTFTRHGTDLYRDLPIALREALLGGQVPVGTLKGRVLLTVPAGTQPGRTFRLSGQGMPRLNSEETGDLHVRVRVVLPTLDERTRPTAEQFLDLVDQPDPRTAAAT